MDTTFIFSFSYDNLTKYFKSNSQANYLFYYLKNVNAKTCILEKEYIDKDYLIDYQKALFCKG